MKHLTELLTLPGSGIFTVQTAKEKKERLLKSYYGTTSAEKARPKWIESLKNLSIERPWVIGVPSDNGGGIQRGANWGPLAVREELLPYRDLFIDLGDVRVIPHLLHDKYLNEKTIKLCQKSLYGKVNKLPVSPLSIEELAVKELYEAHPEARIFGIGGDHSTSYPLVKEWLLSRQNKKKAALLHFDAHTDLLVERMGIDICFGTWTYQVLKYLASREHIIQLGIRSSGRKKSHWEKEVGVKQYWGEEVNKLGPEKLAKKITSSWKKLGVEEIYVSFDIDALDEKYAAATGTPEAGGLVPTDCVALLRRLRQDFKITGADLMEVAPFVCPEGIEPRDQKASLMVAGDMARILIELLTP